MPESRTYDPSAGDPIADAIRAALGETVRPNPPGVKPPARPAAQDEPPRTGPLIIPGMVFDAVPPKQRPKPDADA